MPYKASRRKPVSPEKKWLVYAIYTVIFLIIAGIGLLIYQVSTHKPLETMASVAGDNTLSSLPEGRPPSVSSLPPDSSSSSPSSEPPSAPASSDAASSSTPSSEAPSSKTGDVPVVDPPAEQSGNYKEWYPELCVDKPEYTVKDKTAYLTFDDGPSDITDRVLDILKEKGVKATFFVVGRESADAQRRMQRIVNEGHTIAVHSYTHNYKKIYASVGSYLEDFEHMSRLIESYTGVKPNIFRFPGGSVNSYNKNVYTDLTAEMYRRGYTFHDWNVSTGDADSKGASKQQIINNVLNSTSNLNRAFILCHDAGDKGTTADALPDIIDGLLSQGFTLDALDNSVKPVLMRFK